MSGSVAQARVARAALLRLIPLLWCVGIAMPVAVVAAGQGEAAPSGPTGQSVNRAARDHIRYAIDLAERGAVWSARAELIEALSSVAFTLDAGPSQPIHRASLAAGLQAIREAEDFAPHGLRADAQVDLSRAIATHKSPVLKEVDTSRMSAVDALQSYYGYAAAQLAKAGGREEAASMALYGWGRLEIDPQSAGPNGGTLAVPRAIALQRAALAVDPGNYLAANELAVLVARCEQWSEAKQLLLHSLSVNPTAEAWHNLSRIHAILGEQREAQQAHEEYVALAGDVQASAQGPNAAKAPRMRWVNPAVFLRESGPDQLASLASNPERPTESPPSTSPARDPLSQLSTWFNRKFTGKPGLATGASGNSPSPGGPADRR